MRNELNSYQGATRVQEKETYRSAAFYSSAVALDQLIIIYYSSFAPTYTTYSWGDAAIFALR